jgi:hypothetical protein
MPAGCSLAPIVPRGKVEVLDFSGHSRPGTGSLRQAAIEGSGDSFLASDRVRSQRLRERAAIAW